MASLAERFLPDGPTPVTWREFTALAERHGLVTPHDEVGARHLLAELIERGEVRAVGTWPALSVTRPATPPRPTFTPNDEGQTESSRLLQTNEALRRENQRLRARLDARTGQRG